MELEDYDYGIFEPILKTIKSDPIKHKDNIKKWRENNREKYYVCKKNKLYCQRRTKRNTEKLIKELNA